VLKNKRGSTTVGMVHKKILLMRESHSKSEQGTSRARLHGTYATLIATRVSETDDLARPCASVFDDLRLWTKDTKS
jgi:hypothetical protein